MTIKIIKVIKKKIKIQSKIKIKIKKKKQSKMMNNFLNKKIINNKKMLCKINKSNKMIQNKVQK